MLPNGVELLPNKPPVPVFAVFVAPNAGLFAVPNSPPPVPPNPADVVLLLLLNPPPPPNPLPAVVVLEPKRPPDDVVAAPKAGLGAPKALFDVPPKAPGSK